MPRSNGVETTQRRSIRGTSQIRVSSSDSDPLHHHRSKTDRSSPKLGGVIDRRSPRVTLSDPPVNQKKLGTRIDHLESQLGQAQEELRSLKEQLVSTEDAKKVVVQEQLDGGKSKKAELAEKQEKKCSQKPKRQEMKRVSSNCVEYEISEENLQETDVFEVPIEKVAIEKGVALELGQPTKEGGEHKMENGNASFESREALEQQKPPSFDDLEQKDNEINALKAKLEEKEKELGAFCNENESLKIQLKEKSSSAKSKEEEITLKLNQVIKELDESKNNALEIHQKLEASENAKTALETEMKKLRVQTEQWRKAADAAAAVLSGEVDIVTGGRRVSERCGSMDNNHIGRVFETPGGGYNDNNFIGSPGMIDETDDVFGGAKRKASGIKMFGDLWKKKGQK